MQEYKGLTYRGIQTGEHMVGEVSKLSAVVVLLSSGLISVFVRSNVLLMSLSVAWTSGEEHEIMDGLRWGAGAGGGGVN